MPFPDLSHLVDSILTALKNPDTWSLIVSILYAAVLGVSGFVIKKFGIRIARNAKHFEKITINVETITAENKQYKAENERLKAEIGRRDVDYTRLEEAYRIQDELFDTSRSQWDSRESQYREELERLRRLPPGGSEVSR